MDPNQPTIKQIVFFTVVLSFFVSVIGTVLTSGLLMPFNSAESLAPFSFSRPLEKITEKILEKEVQERISRQDELIVSVVERASPAVVSIIATKDVPIVEQFFVDPFASDPFFEEFFGGGGSGFRVPELRERGTEKKQISAGTGFVVSPEGLLVTNRHVVTDTAAEFTVFLSDGRQEKARVLARDPVTDLAVLKIEATGLTPLKLSSSNVKIGQTVIAIGNALGEFSNTVSVGIVSGLHRSIVASGGRSGAEMLEELIQTDAAINPGNSGGPLLNLDGEVIGVNTAMAQGAENIGFAISASKVRRDLDQVAQGGRIVYSFLGVRYTIVTKELAEKEGIGRDYGVLIVGSTKEPAITIGSPAEKAGLAEKDIILELNGERIDAKHTLASLLQKYQPGQEITLKILRGGQDFDIKVALGERK